mmetsp:Transcript_36612/g.118272  ORF Transcript_36612/g.118272 Transcript_36612/m.118272 type:complete len:455 (+) Transcript_36612:3530-4894(+)
MVGTLGSCGPEEAARPEGRAPAARRPRRGGAPRAGGRGAHPGLALGAAGVGSDGTRALGDEPRGLANHRHELRAVGAGSLRGVAGLFVHGLRAHLQEEHPGAPAALPRPDHHLQPHLRRRGERHRRPRGGRLLSAAGALRLHRQGRGQPRRDRPRRGLLHVDLLAAGRVQRVRWRHLLHRIRADLLRVGSQPHLGHRLPIQCCIHNGCSHVLPVVPLRWCEARRAGVRQRPGRLRHSVAADVSDPLGAVEFGLPARGGPGLHVPRARGRRAGAGALHREWLRHGQTPTALPGPLRGGSAALARRQRLGLPQRSALPLGHLVPRACGPLLAPAQRLAGLRGSAVLRLVVRAEDAPLARRSDDVLGVRVDLRVVPVGLDALSLSATEFLLALARPDLPKSSAPQDVGPPGVATTTTFCFVNVCLNIDTRPEGSATNWMRHKSPSCLVVVQHARPTA